jgi:NitT/TauT family transport system permease protein
MAVAFLFFAMLVSLWEVAVRSGRWSVVLLPSPLYVAEYLWGALLDSSLLEAAWVTLRRLLVGYAAGVLIGLPLGLLTSISQSLEDTVGALAVRLQTLPSVCWVPLALVWFGQTESAMLFVVIMGTVWSVIIATDYGPRSIPPIYARAARTMGSEGFHKWTRVILPASLSFLVTGMKQGWAFAWRSGTPALLARLAAQVRRRGRADLEAAGRSGPGCHRRVGRQPEHAHADQENRAGA